MVNNTTEWWETDTPHASLYLAMGIYLTSIGVFATIANVAVLVVILSSRKLRRKPHNIMIVNLAVADLGVCLLSYPLTSVSSYLGHWVFGNVTCIVTAFVTYLLSVGNINTLLCVCIYRYIVICKPQFLSFLTLQGVRLALCAVWVHALFWTSLPLLGWGKYCLEPFGTSCSLAWGNTEYSNVTYNICSVVVCYLVHVVVMARLYTKIAVTTRGLMYGHAVPGRGYVTNTDEIWNRKLRTDRSVTLMCFLSTVVFLLVWTPYAVYSIVYSVYPNMPLFFTIFPTMFAKSGCTLNPVVYFCTNHTFRSACFSRCRTSRRDTANPEPAVQMELHVCFDDSSHDDVRNAAVVGVDTTAF